LYFHFFFQHLTNAENTISSLSLMLKPTWTANDIPDYTASHPRRQLIFFRNILFLITQYKFREQTQKRL
jgi:hypothetical protein